LYAVICSDKVNQNQRKYIEIPICTKQNKPKQRKTKQNKTKQNKQSKKQTQKRMYMYGL